MMRVGKIDFEWLVPILLQAAFKVADALVKGEELSEDMKRGVQSLYFELKQWVLPEARKTETPWDDAVIERILALFEDTAEEGGFELVSPPEV